MSRICGHNLSGGGQCKQPVADQSRPDCGRHTAAATVAATTDLVLDGNGCWMYEAATQAWRCRIHGTPDWDIARAMGALPPCQIPWTVLFLGDLAGQEPIDPGTALLLLNESDPEVRRKLAGNKSAPGEVLEVLSRGNDDLIRLTIAANPATLPTTLRRLVQDMSGVGIYAIASNANAPGDVLAQLAGNLNSSVRGAVALHPATPRPTLELLANDRESAVRIRVPTNPSIAPELLARLSRDRDPKVAEAALRGLRLRETGAPHRSMI